MKHHPRVWSVLLLCAVLLAAAFPAAALAESKSPAREVFGFTLGQPFPKALQERLEEGEDGFLQYQTDCPDPDAPFQRIKVRVSPRTRLVVDVSAAGIFHECSQGQAAFWPLKAGLEATYGKAVKKKQSGGERFEIKKGKLRVVFYLRPATFEEHCILYGDFMDLGTYKKYGKEAHEALENKPAGPQP